MVSVLVRKPTVKEEALLKAQPTWEHEPEKWKTVYDEREETCLVIEGSAYVETMDGERYHFAEGDLVTLNLIWNAGGVWRNQLKSIIFLILDI